MGETVGLMLTKRARSDVTVLRGLIARLWNQGMRTDRIAQVLGISEAEVYNHRIRMGRDR